jgi:hypothetical protein
MDVNFLAAHAFFQSMHSSHLTDERMGGEPRELALGHDLRNPLASIDNGAAL